MNAISKIEAGEKTTTSLGVAGDVNLRTPCGARRIENIRVGDLIVTRDNGLQPVKMVFTHTVTATDTTADPSLFPVRLQPRVLGPMMPGRSMLVGGDHRLLVPGYRLADVPDTSPCLISARAIADGSDQAFVDRSVAEITYYNLVFDAHEVFAANGLAIESFQPSRTTLQALDKATIKRIKELFPGVGRRKEAYPAASYPMPNIFHCNPEFA